MQASVLRLGHPLLGGRNKVMLADFHRAGVLHHALNETRSEQFYSRFKPR